MKSAILLVIFSLGVISTTDAQTLYLNNRQYDFINGQWYQVEYGREYLVNESVITVKFLESTEISQINAFNSSQEVQVLRMNILGYFDLRIPEDSDPLTIVQNYLSSGLVEIAEPNTYGEYFEDSNDSLFTSQWHHKYSQDHDIDTPDAWDWETGEEVVIIGVLDSGTDILHEDLENNIWVNPGEDLDNDGVVWDNDDMNGVDDDGNGKVDDLVGWDFDHDNNDVEGPYHHGTFVAGIPGAVTNNIFGVAGVAGGWGQTPGSSLLICNVGDRYADASIVDDAILYAAQENANVITMSFGLGETSAINNAIETAYVTYGVFINCSSGNGDLPTVNYPARAQYVYGVGASNKSDQKAGFSNYGDSLDVVAPGVDIWTTRKNNDYLSVSGTSCASPMVAGVAALLFSYNGSYTNTFVEEIIAKSAEKVGGYGYDDTLQYGAWDDSMGYGRINAFYAVAPPAAPQNLTLTNEGGNPRLNWDANTEPDLKEYNIYKELSINCFPCDVDTLIIPEPTNTYLDTLFDIGGSPPWDLVKYWIKAVDITDQESAPSNSRTKKGQSDIQWRQEANIISAIPKAYNLSPNSPNPFNPNTTIRYDLPEQSHVSLVIYDILGREVRTLLDNREDAGFKSVVWDSKDSHGNIASAGIYIYMLRTWSQESDKTYHKTRKMVLLR